MNKTHQAIPVIDSDGSRVSWQLRRIQSRIKLWSCEAFTGNLGIGRPGNTFSICEKKLRDANCFPHFRSKRNRLERKHGMPFWEKHRALKLIGGLPKAWARRLTGC